MFARQVTVSFSSIKPEVLPAMAVSFVCLVEFLCTSMLLAKSKTRSIGAFISVNKRMRGIS
jgi:hypothetical protein